MLLGTIPIQLNAATYGASLGGEGHLGMLVDFPGPVNQGIVLADAAGLTLVAAGCGNWGGGAPWGGGCGDPTPIGGTFSGMFHTPALVPDVNARGDVLFLSDVEGGSSIRGLFFYERATQSILNVASIGDSTPVGGTFGSVGAGSVNDNGEVVFLAWRSSVQEAMIVRWKQGALQNVVASGDPGPAGGSFTGLIFSGIGSTFGPTVPTGAPRIRADGHVMFCAIANQRLGLFEEFNGQFVTLANTQDPAPGGGAFFNFRNPLPNEQGDVAFTAEQFQGPPYTPAWFRGRPGQWERVIGVGDVIGGGTVTVINGSYGPHKPMDAAGNLIVFAKQRDSITLLERSVVVLARRGFAPRVLLGEGDPSPMGGVVTALPWDLSMSPTSVAAVGMNTTAPSGLGSVYALLDICVPPDSTVYCTAKTNSAGCTPRISASGIPSASASAGFVVQAENMLNAKQGILLCSQAGAAATPFGGGTLCLQAPIKRALPVSAGGTPPPAVDCTGVLRLDMNAFAANQLGGTPAFGLSVPGTTVRCQWWGRDPGFAPGLNVQLSDAVEYRVTP